VVKGALAEKQNIVGNCDMTDENKRVLFWLQR
jgi:hypothetical protein